MGRQRAPKSKTPLKPSEDLLRRAKRVKAEGVVKRVENARAHEATMLEILAIYFELADS